MAYNFRASGIKFIGFDGQEIQTFFEQAFNMSQLGLILPSLAAANTISESLIA